MQYLFGRQDFKSLERGEENCFLMTNGLGGFSSMTAAFSCSRNDHSLLMSCKKEEAPNHRYQMIHRLEEILSVGDKTIHLSSQKFTKREMEEDGYRYLSSFCFEDYPVWKMDICGVEVKRSIVLAPGKNAVVVRYEIQNRSDTDVYLKVIPQMVFAPKGKALEPNQIFSIVGNRISSNGQELYYFTNGSVETFDTKYQEELYYVHDVCDGRDANGTTAFNHCISFCVTKAEKYVGEICYNLHNEKLDFDVIRDEYLEERRQIREMADFQNETAQTLALAAQQFIAYRNSTGEKTILAGFPFFEDWGRDTMISLPGCCIATKQFDTAKSILRTFMKNCKNGLMPNLFPEGALKPLYNTVDAALLFIITVYEYYKASGDSDFVLEAYPIMKDIVDNYAKGTEYHIGMDDDGLIYAGAGLEQVTWMDVRVGDILPTPRHGKPVEINAYWYNVLCMMKQFKELFKMKDDFDYEALSETVKQSFQEKFWNEKAGCLKDVLCGTDAENQIRCNQIWAVSLPFSVLEKEYEKAVVEKVYQHLYTPLGLRTLSPEDKEFKEEYSGDVLKRDLSYHQGTVWVFPLGAYYLAYLKVNDYSEAARMEVYDAMQAIASALREGCIGQLPEIYDGLIPTSSRGCFAQAWSVAEILRVFRALE